MEVLIGQDRAKVYLEQIVAKAKVDKIRLKNGLEVKKNSLHTALIGAPGTG
ncbi:MAG: ATPase, partial [Deltaproteobacteria bacterium]